MRQLRRPTNARERGPAGELRALAGELVARLRSAPAGVARKVAGELRAELDRDWSEPS